MLRLAKNMLSGIDAYIETKVFPVGLGYTSSQFSCLSGIHATLNFILGPLSCSKKSSICLKMFDFFYISVSCFYFFIYILYRFSQQYTLDQPLLAISLLISLVLVSHLETGNKPDSLFLVVVIINKFIPSLFFF